jgi:protein-tyrosine-phosphatase
LAGERVEVFTGGTDPTPLVDLTATAAMAEVGIDIGGELPQPSPAEVLGAVDLVVVMGEGIAHEVDLGELAPATAVQIWPVAEASELPLDDLRTLRDDIGRRIAALVARLPPGPS